MLTHPDILRILNFFFFFLNFTRVFISLAISLAQGLASGDVGQHFFYFSFLAFDFYLIFPKS